MEHALDTFDFARRSDDTTLTSTFEGLENQYSDSTIFRSEGVHWRCGHCVESVIYSFVSGHVEHVRIWKCCQCGFPDNRVSLWDECSMCDGTNFLDDYACHRPFPIQIATDDAIYDRATSESSHVVHAESLGTENSLGAYATDDLVSTVRQNMTPFESFLRDERLEEDGLVLGSMDASVSTGSMRYCGIDTDTVELGFQSVAEFPTSYSIDIGAMATIPSEDPTSTVSTSTTTSLTPSTLTARTLQDLDSGYGSQCNTSNSDQSLRKRSNESDHQTTSVVDNNTNNTSPPPRKRPRRRRLDPLNPGLVCPFYVRNPDRCKHDSCAGPGFLGIHRLKQHLERVHLYYSCERCGAIFYGSTAGRERLAVHQRNTQPCQLLANPRPEIWGLNYATFEAMRSKKGAAGKPEEERWRVIHRLIFPDAEEKEMAMPYVNAESAKQRHDDQTRLSTQHQALENFSRELIRILPARLNAAIGSRLHDAKLIAMWNDFASDQLHDVLRSILAETSSSANAPPLVEIRTSDGGGLERRDDSSCFDVMDFVNC